MSTAEPLTLIEDVAQKPAPQSADAKVLLALLQRHYINPKDPEPGGAFLTEVAFNGTWGGSRADALYMGFTSASGRILIGHEVKVSRADWRRELDKHGKADPWADQCHEWWIVAPPGVVPVEELPQDWGLLNPPTGRKRVRMHVVKPAHGHTDRVPGWDAVRSFTARYDTVRRAELASDLKAVRENMAAKIDAGVARRFADQESWNRGRVEAMEERLAGVAAVLGVEDIVDGNSYGNRIGKRDLERLVPYAKALGGIHQQLDALTNRYRSPLKELEQILEALRTNMDTLQSLARPALDGDHILSQEA